MWIILRTDAAKEHYVARQLALAGHEAWVPCQLIASRTQTARRVTAQAMNCKIKELPLLPRKVLARWDMATSQLWLPRHAIGADVDGYGSYLSIPDSQIAAFRAEIDRVNTAALALASRPNRKQKAQWRSLKDALVDMMESAKQKMEEAA